MKDANILSIPSMSGVSIEKTAMEGVFNVCCPSPPDTQKEAEEENVEWGYGAYDPKYVIIWGFHKVIWKKLESSCEYGNLPLIPMELLKYEEIGCGYPCKATLQVIEEDFSKLPPLVRQLLTYEQPTAINLSSSLL